jgi:long-chain acyl-CoA synthetase
VSAETILSFLAERAARFPDAPAVHHRVDGVWHRISLKHLVQTSERVADSLINVGLKPGERLAIMCRTRVEWLLAELGAMMAGVVVVGIDAHASDLQIAEILENSDVSGLVVDSEAALSRIRLPLLERLSLIVTIEDTGRGKRYPHLRPWCRLVGGDWVVTGSRTACGWRAADAERKLNGYPSPTANSPATLLYTSGTTGKPKGILYRHEQLAVACRSILEEFPGVSKLGGSTICWLPMAALFQRMMNYVALVSGVAVYFVDDSSAILRATKEVQPTYFIGVPRFFEKLYQGIQFELALKPKRIQQLVAISLARSPRVAGLRSRVGTTVEQRVLDALVLRRLRRVLGRRLDFIITGSAPTPEWLLDYFDRLGILVLEAYGLSENTVPIAANRPEAWRFGSVGKVFRRNEVRLAEDGEILVRGPGLFDGYVGNETANIFTTDRFYRTGDLGRFDADGFLFVSGRKSEVFKMSTGRRIAPGKIEAVYRKIPYVEQIVVVGQGRQYPAALLSVNPQLLALALEGGGVSLAGGASATNLASLPAVKSKIKADIEAAGAELGSYEKIRRFDLLPLPLTLDGGELTPSLKLKRDVIECKYRDMIERLYTTPA